MERKHDKEIRSAQNGVVHDIRYLPFAIKQAVAERFYEPAMDSLGYGLAQKDQWATILYFKITDSLGPENIVIFNQRLGVSSEQEAIALIDAGRAMDGLKEMGTEARFDAALEVLKMCLQERPDFLARCEKMLSSYAEVQE